MRKTKRMKHLRQLVSCKWKGNCLWRVTLTRLYTSFFSIVTNTYLPTCANKNRKGYLILPWNRKDYPKVLSRGWNFRGIDWRNAITDHCVIRNATRALLYLWTCYFWDNFNEKVGARKLIFNAIKCEIIKEAPPQRKGRELFLLMAFVNPDFFRKLFNPLKKLVRTQASRAPHDKSEGGNSPSPLPFPSSYRLFRASYSRLHALLSFLISHDYH